MVPSVGIEIKHFLLVLLSGSKPVIDRLVASCLNGIPFYIYLDFHLIRRQSEG